MSVPRTVAGWRLPFVLASLGVVLAALPGCKDRCRDTDGCKSKGKCATRGEVCIATDDADCRASKACEVHGLCTARGECIATSDQECASSEACKVHGRCVARNNMCCTRDGPCEKPKVRPALPPGVKGEEGCPCGCDHSEQMAAELSSKPAGEAKQAILSSLAAIGEREDAGYVTVAMVEHRRRLLALARRRDLGVSARPSAPAPSGDNPPVLVANDRLRVAADLIVHGEHSELVRGREKLLKAAFVVNLELENLSDQAWTLGRPEITGALRFPVERWYTLGTEGEPWSGALAAREKRSLYVIGYLSSDVTPGNAIHATLTLDGLRLELDTRARRKWYGLTEAEAPTACTCHAD